MYYMYLWFELLQLKKWVLVIKVMYSFLNTQQSRHLKIGYTHKNYTLYYCSASLVFVHTFIFTPVQTPHRGTCVLLVFCLFVFGFIFLTTKNIKFSNGDTNLRRRVTYAGHFLKYQFFTQLSAIKTFWKWITAAKQMEMCHCQNNIVEAQNDPSEPWSLRQRHIRTKY